MMNFRNLLLACALGGSIAAGAVIPAAAQVYAGVYVQTAPPAPIYESVPAVPGPGYAWVAGYWSWNGYRYVGVHGRYAYAPYGGAVWHAGRWAHGPYGWYWRAGRWGRPY
jgi:hypothetical protein